jgi:hypothetical protein
MKTLVIRKYHSGYRFYCTYLQKYYGPTFKNENYIISFDRWIDGCPRYIGTELDCRNWNDVVSEWIKAKNMENSVYNYVTSV